MTSSASVDHRTTSFLQNQRMKSPLMPVKIPFTTILTTYLNNFRMLEQKQSPQPNQVKQV